MESDQSNSVTDYGWLIAAMQLKGFEPNGLLGWHYTGKIDAGPLGAMLFNYQNPPPFIIELVANLLLGSDGMPRIKLLPPKDPKHFQSLIDNLSEMRKARDEFPDRLKNARNRKEAIAATANDYEKKNSWVEEALKLNDKDYIEAIERKALPESDKKRRKRTDIGQISKMSKTNI